MSTSGSFDYLVTASDIITEAAESIGALASGETMSANDQTSFLRTLNMMAKQWSGNIDFAPGLKAFSRKIGYMFLQKSQSAYSLGPSGDNATLSYVSTTMRIGGTATNTTLEITASTGMTASDKIGIELDSGSIQWTTISSVTDSDTIVIAAGLTSSAAIGNRIFSYTTKLIRPLYIETAVLRDTNGNDVPMYSMGLQEYESLPSKAADGQPSYYHFRNTITNATLYLDVEPSDVTYVMRMVFMAPAEDYDAVANDIAFPQEWYLPLALGLSKLMTAKFAQKWSDLNESNYQSALAIARSSYAETITDYFQPGLE